MSVKRPHSGEQVLTSIFRAVKIMPESRLTVITNFIISIYVLSLVYTGDVGGFVGVTGVVAINGVTSGLLYTLGSALEEAEKQQQPP